MADTYYTLEMGKESKNYTLVSSIEDLGSIITWSIIYSINYFLVMFFFAYYFTFAPTLLIDNSLIYILSQLSHPLLSIEFDYKPIDNPLFRK